MRSFLTIRSVCIKVYNLTPLKNIRKNGIIYKRQVITLYPKDYYYNFDEIGDSVVDADGVLHVELLSISEETKCPFCGGSNIKKIGFRKKKGFMDITAEGAPVEITFKLQRYICEDCAEKKKANENSKVQTTFTADCLPDCIRKNKQISTDMIDAIVNKVAREHMSIADTASSVDICSNAAFLCFEIISETDAAETCILSAVSGNWYLICGKKKPSQAFLLY